eukprot:Lithocolla_globosa_v1_NODE_4060_length_1519_cov_26.323770.p1 type:complete len:480 gc:universal NODE_4060_length_1519_cov_26.323770:1444-5(-)
MFSVVLLLFSLALAEVIFLPPSNQILPARSLLVCVPGMYIPGEEYLPVCSGIQQDLVSSSSVSLWVAILTFTNDAVNPIELRAGFREAMELARETGFSDLENDDIWCLGHSFGGVQCATQVESDDYAGMIMFGSYTINGIASYSKPIIHLSGELDGLRQSTGTAEDFIIPRNLLAQGREQEAVLLKPVVLFPGMNHNQMGNDFQKSPMDFKPEISLEEATFLLISRSSAFLTLHLNKVNDTSVPFNLILQDMMLTETYVSFFLNSQESDDSLAQCLEAQPVILNVVPSVYERLELIGQHFIDEDEFVSSKPDVTSDTGGENATIFTTSFVEYTEPNTKSCGRYAYECNCKLKTQDAIIQILNLSPDDYIRPRGTCKSINENRLRIALDTVPAVVRDRYLSVGKPLILLDDENNDRGDLWVPSHVTYQEEEEGLYVTASSLYTGIVIPTDVAGNQYCKAMPSARIAAWLMHDSLPRGFLE